MIKKLIEKVQKWRENKRLIVVCDTCGKKFNLQEQQSGVCSHVPIKRYVYGIDKGSNDGDWNAEVKGYMDENGKFVITESKTWRMDKTAQTYGYFDENGKLVITHPERIVVVGIDSGGFAKDKNKAK